MESLCAVGHAPHLSPADAAGYGVDEADGNNTPVFFVRDPSNFQDFIHSQKRRADTDRRDNNMQWDFWTLKPESAHHSRSSCPIAARRRPCVT